MGRHPTRIDDGASETFRGLAKEVTVPVMSCDAIEAVI